eukprot:39024-Prymnesium_polylepis.1
MAACPSLSAITRLKSSDTFSVRRTASRSALLSLAFLGGVPFGSSAAHAAARPLQRPNRATARDVPGSPAAPVRDGAIVVAS